MMILGCLATVFMGITLNLAFSSMLIQPDWAWAILLAAVLAHRRNWLWVLPAALMHEWMLYWSIGSGVFLLALIPLAMIYFDRRLGPGLPQRMLLMVVALSALLLRGVDGQVLLLTLLLVVPCWHVMAGFYAKQSA